VSGFADRLRYLRTARGLSQGDLASALGLSKQAISSYETRGAEPSIDTLRKMAAFFGVSVDYLTGESAVEVGAEGLIGQILSVDPELAAFWRELRERRDVRELVMELAKHPPEDVVLITEFAKVMSKRGKESEA